MGCENIDLGIFHGNWREDMSNILFYFAFNGILKHLQM